MKRLTHLDWLRGLAVVIMILWHTMDSWTAPSGRHNATFEFITLAGGWAAPLFLFLAGVSIALAGRAMLARPPIDSPPEESESSSAAGRASGGGAPRATNIADSLPPASSSINALGAPPPSARAPSLEDSLSSRGAAGAAVAGDPPPRAAAAALEDSLSSRRLRAAAATLQKRGWQIFLLAHLFRLQSFLLNPGATWESLLKPDILNILGLGMVAAAWCWGRAITPAYALGSGVARRTGMPRRRRARQIAWLLGPAAVILLLTPGSRSWSWPTIFRAFAPRLEAYIRPVSGMGVFSVFPWVAFVLVGAWIGTHIAARQSEDSPRRLNLELAIVGLVLGVSGLIGRHVPPLSSQSSFWTTSVSFFVIRTGAMTLLIPAVWLWTQRPTAHHWSPMVLFGRTSLFVYWIHVELAYGVFSYPLHGALSLRAALAAYVVFTAVMLGLAELWRRRATSNFKLQTSNSRSESLGA